MSRVSRKLGTAAVVWNARGLRGLLAAARCWLRFRETYVRLAVDLETWSAPAPAGPAIDVTRGDGAALPATSDTRDPLPVEFHVRVRGRRHYLGRVDGHVAHITWVFFPGDPSRFLALGRGQVEITDSHTTRAYRNRGIYQGVLHRILGDMRAEGFRTAYTHVAVGNASSLRAMHATGFQPVAVVTARRLLGVYWTRARPAIVVGQEGARS